MLSPLLGEVTVSRSLRCGVSIVVAGEVAGGGGGVPASLGRTEADRGRSCHTLDGAVL